VPPTAARFRATSTAAAGRPSPTPPARAACAARRW
jgi:hypothetical protein